MENASKALLIAGGIFLALALITFGVYTYSSLHGFSKSQDEKNAQEQLAAFNKSFEAYNKSIMHGTDLITVMNKAIDNNERYNDNNYTITINFELSTESEYTYKASGIEKTGKISVGSHTQDDWKYIKTLDNLYCSNLKNKIFECTGVTYNSNTGRINIMNFKEI